MEWWSCFSCNIKCHVLGTVLTDFIFCGKCRPVRFFIKFDGICHIFFACKLNFLVVYVLGLRLHYTTVVGLSWTLSLSRKVRHDLHIFNSAYQWQLFCNFCARVFLISVTFNWQTRLHITLYILVWPHLNFRLTARVSLYKLFPLVIFNSEWSN
jgi:hypothetical protein